MAISPSSSSQISLHHSSPKLKRSQALAIDIRKKLLKKRPRADYNLKTMKVKSENMRSPANWMTSTTNQLKGCLKTNSCAMTRAQEVQARLPPGLPSFMKLLLPSHVAGGFWLSFPRRFCCAYLPKQDEMVVLVDEKGEEFQAKYLVSKNGLSGGWRGFSIAHKLLDGDVLVFQKIEHCKLKVYIVRANELETDGALSLLDLDIQAKPLEIEDIKICGALEHEYLEPPTQKTSENCNEEDKKVSPLDQSGNESDNLGSEVLEGIRFSEKNLDFKDVKDFHDFNILVDGLVIDTEIPSHLKIKYYDLCLSQKSFLHDHLIKGLNIKLAAGVISETINIADAIRAAKPTTSLDHLETWDRTLKAFEDLGMKVGFLRARLNKLVSFSCESKEIIELKKLEKAEAEERKRALESDLLDVKDVIRILGAEIKILGSKSERVLQMFKELAAAPW